MISQRKVIFACKPSLIGNRMAKLVGQHVSYILHGTPMSNEIKTNSTIALLVQVGKGFVAPRPNFLRTWRLAFRFMHLRSILRHDQIVGRALSSLPVDLQLEAVGKKHLHHMLL